ncbi:MAG: sensor histidine kinase, partial [Campylobacterales bacterium]
RKVYADRVLLEIVFINLIENALKYSETDIGIEIGVESISVIDSGMGLDEGELENITKKFYRVNKNTWNSSLGLGLFIVKYILELHGSELKIESRPSIGSKFCFNL